MMFQLETNWTWNRTIPNGIWSCEHWSLKGWLRSLWHSDLSFQWVAHKDRRTHQASSLDSVFWQVAEEGLRLDWYFRHLFSLIPSKTTDWDVSRRKVIKRYSAHFRSQISSVTLVVSGNWQRRGCRQVPPKDIACNRVTFRTHILKIWDSERTMECNCNTRICLNRYICIERSIIERITLRRLASSRYWKIDSILKYPRFFDIHSYFFAAGRICVYKIIEVLLPENMIKIHWQSN